MAAARVLFAVLACIVLMRSVAAVATSLQSSSSAIFADRITAGLAKHKSRPFVTPSGCKGLFIQEFASKQLPGPGQHFRFGALKEWEQVHQTLPQGSKLVLLIRHGQAISNWLSDTLGPDTWYGVESTCTYKDDNGTSFGIFDAELTKLGIDQAKSLNSMLNGGGWFKKLSGGKSARIVMSPLSRCLHTTQLVTDGLKSSFTSFTVEEDVRETLGEDTCDARRSATDPAQSKTGEPGDLEGPCEFDKGLRTKFPGFQFPIRAECPQEDGLCANSGFGLSSDEDHLWTLKRESQRKQVKRATRFLTTLFDHAEEEVIFVITHSGFTRSLLLAVGREPYRPQNTELVPVIIIKSAGSQPSYQMEDISDTMRGWSDDDEIEEALTAATQKQHQQRYSSTAHRLRGSAAYA